MPEQSVKYPTPAGYNSAVMCIGEYMGKAISPKISVILPTADKEALEKVAAREDRTVSNLAARILHQWLVNEGEIAEE